MIALNELLKNTKQFEDKYNLMGKRYNLEKIINLANKRTLLQRETESMRAKCNKLCAEVAEHKNSGKLKSEDINNIIKLDHLTTKNQKLLAKMDKKINKMLSKLANPAVFDNLKPETIGTNLASSTLEEFETFLTQLGNLSESKNGLNKLLKQYQNKLVSYNELPSVKSYKNGYLIFSDKLNQTIIYPKLIDFLKNHSVNAVAIPITQLRQYAAEELVFTLNDSIKLKVELANEYLSRKYKIKYHDQLEDMSRFVNQINIEINKK